MPSVRDTSCFIRNFQQEKKFHTKEAKYERREVTLNLLWDCRQRAGSVIKTVSIPLKSWSRNLTEYVKKRFFLKIYLRLHKYFVIIWSDKHHVHLGDFYYYNARGCSHRQTMYLFVFHRRLVRLYDYRMWRTVLINSETQNNN